MSKILKYYKHFTPVKVRFSDLDIAGHLNNAKYQTFMEEARIAHFHDVCSKAKSCLDFNVVMSKISIDFIKPIEFGDDIIIYTRIFNITEHSHEVHQLFVRREKDKHEIVATAQSVMAAFDYHTKKLTTFPEEYREAIRSFEETGEISSPGNKILI